MEPRMTKRKLPPLTRADYADAYKALFGRDFAEIEIVATHRLIDRMHAEASADVQKLVALNDADILAGRRVPYSRHVQISALFATQDWLAEMLERIRK
jgi:hypothetical protein